MEQPAFDGVPEQAAAERVALCVDGKERTGNCWIVPKGKGGSGYRYRFVSQPREGFHLHPRARALLAIIEAGEQEKQGWNREEIKTLVAAMIPSTREVGHTIQDAQVPLLKEGLIRIEPGPPLEVKPTLILPDFKISS